MAALTAASGLVLGLLPAVFVGVVLTLFLVIVELDRVGITELQPTPRPDDVRAAGPGTVAVPGLLILRLDGPLYTANVRSVNRKLLDAVDGRPDARVLVVDATVQARLSFTVINELPTLEHELADRDITLWFAGLPPVALETARQLPRWDEFEAAGRLHATSLAALHAYDGAPHA